MKVKGVRLLLQYLATAEASCESLGVQRCLYWIRVTLPSFRMWRRVENAYVSEEHSASISRILHSEYFFTWVKLLQWNYLASWIKWWYYLHSFAVVVVAYFADRIQRCWFICWRYIVSVEVCRRVIIKWRIRTWRLRTKLNSVALVRERTIPTERPPPVGEGSANFCG